MRTMKHAKHGISRGLMTLGTLLATSGVALAHPGHGADDEGTGLFHMLFDHPVALTAVTTAALALVVQRVRRARARARG